MLITQDKQTTSLTHGAQCAPWALVQRSCRWASTLPGTLGHQHVAPGTFLVHQRKHMTDLRMWTSHQHLCFFKNAIEKLYRCLRKNRAGDREKLLC